MKTRFKAWKSPLYLRVALLLFFSITPLFAQNAVTVTNSSGDGTVPGSLGWAVSIVNTWSSGGSVTFSSATSPTLIQTLTPFSQSVTFEGGDLGITGQNSAESQLLFQQDFTQSDHLQISNNGLGAGLDVAVTASSWTMGSVNGTTLNAANAATISTTGGVNVTGADGGNAAVTVGAWTTGISEYLYSGAGGSVTDTNGSGDQGGTGGSASVSATSMAMPGTGFFYLYGGAGGSVTDLGTGTNSGGDGGWASAAFGSVSISSTGNVGIIGGNGGAGVTGGAGGAATLAAGSVSVSQNFDVFAGQGGSGVSLGGDGGSGYVSFGSYNGNTGSNFQLTGGNGGNTSSGTGGAGGGIFVAGGTLTIVGVSPNAPIFKALGGNGGTGITGGDGGSAGISLTGLVIGPSATLQVTGGNGSGGNAGASPGNGGQGGDTSFSLGSFSIGVSTTLNIASGNGGSGGDSTNSGGTGGNGGAGGALAVTLGALNLGTGSILNLTGGTGGNGGAVVSGGTGGTGGDGGNVSLSIGAVTMASGNFLNVSGGGAGNGGNAGTNGPVGATGQASASIGDLEGAGTLDMTGNAQLQVAQGSFSGSINGSEVLEKTGAATLTLSGNNSYSGGTSILGGTFLVDTGGILGTGEVQVESGTYLDYINASNASNSYVTVASGGSVSFLNNASAGSATISNDSLLTFSGSSSAANALITTYSGATIIFSGNSNGGAATIGVYSGSALDISTHSGGLTIGSVDGAGNIYLGSNNLNVGSNNNYAQVGTPISGVIQDGGIGGGIGGSLTKSGTGMMVMAGDNTYSGGTNITDGWLVAVNTHALGTGSVSLTGGVLALGLVNGGTILTGPTTLQISNNYFQGPNGTLQLGVGGAGASLQDYMNITGGNTSLNGTLDLISYGPLSAMPIGNSVIILSSASTISGMFQQVNESYNGIRLLPIYLSNAVELESIIPSFQAIGTTSNQKAIGADLDTVALNPKMYNLMTSIGVLSNTDVQTAYGQMTPEDFTGLFQAGFEGALSRTALVDQRLSQLMDEVDNTVWLPGFSSTGTPWFAANLPAKKEAAMAPRQYSPWGGFISGDGGFFDVSADSNAAGYKVTTFGLTGAGADYRLSREAMVGLMVGYGHTDVSMGTGGTLTADGGQVGLYGLFYSEGFYAGGLVEGGLNTYGTQRLGYGGIAKGTSQGTQYDGALELGYQFKQDQVKIGPMAQVQYSSVGMDAFTEQGSLAPLSVPAQTESSLLSCLGVRASSRWTMGSESALTPTLQLAWEHENNFQGGTFQAGFGTGDSFTVAGPQIGQDGFMAGAGVGLSFGKSLTVSLNYQGEFGRTNLTSSQIGGGMKIGF